MIRHESVNIHPRLHESVTFAPGFKLIFQRYVILSKNHTFSGFSFPAQPEPAISQLSRAHSPIVKRHSYAITPGSHQSVSSEPNNPSSGSSQTPSSPARTDLKLCRAHIPILTITLDVTTSGSPQSPVSPEPIYPSSIATLTPSLPARPNPELARALSTLTEATPFHITSGSQKSKSIPSAHGIDAYLPPASWRG